MKSLRRQKGGIEVSAKGEQARYQRRRLRLTFKKHKGGFIRARIVTLHSKKSHGKTGEGGESEKRLVSQTGTGKTPASSPAIKRVNLPGARGERKKFKNHP